MVLLQVTQPIFLWSKIMTKEDWEEQTVFGDEQEKEKKIRELKAAGWIVSHEVGCYVPFGIEIVVPGTVMKRKK